MEPQKNISHARQWSQETLGLVGIIKLKLTSVYLFFYLQILNKYDSWISFLSSVRYWMAFNIERACQSYFGCVQCISGPLGMYRNSLLHEFVEDWYNQEFMGNQCSFGDDRHLTNRVLSLGYATKYTARSKCLTETPIEYLRWLNQQTRWSKSYFREWLYNAMWFHKHHLWMTYEAVITGFFPFFLIATVIQLFYRGKIWNILLFLLTVQLVGLIKSSFASCLRGNIVMVFMSLYSVLYMSSLLPAKMFAIATINKAGWGTSGRKTIVVNFIGLIPVSVWFTILLGGVIFTIYKESKKPFSESKQTVLIVGTLIYACYWVMLLTLYVVLINKCGRRKKGQQYDMVLDVWLTGMFAVTHGDNTHTHTLAPPGVVQYCGISSCHHRRHITAAGTWTKTCDGLIFDSAKVNWHISKKKLGFNPTFWGTWDDFFVYALFPLLCIRLTVFVLYTSLAMLYVGDCGRKGFWKLKGTFFQPTQPNLWTFLIDDFFLSFFKEKCLSSTLPNQMPKENLKATGYAVFWYNCTVFLHFVCQFLKTNFTS